MSLAGVLFAIVLVAALPGSSLAGHVTSSPVAAVVSSPVAALTSSPVADAAMRGDTDAVRALLQQGADVNASQGDGMTALHWAAERGDAALARMLIQAGATVDPVTRIGQYTPLHIAAKAGSEGVVERLLATGADASARTSGGASTPLHLAALSGNAAIVRALLAHGADPDAREAQWGQTPLIFAASQNRADAITALLEAGADPNLGSETVDLVEQGLRDRFAGERLQAVLEAFGTAAAQPTASQVTTAVLASRQAFLAGPVEEPAEEDDDGRGPQAASVTSMGGLTPLLQAARQGHREAVDALLAGGADIDQVSASDGTSPLLMATINGQFDLAIVLIEGGADPNIASELTGATPLWSAVNAEWQPRTRYPQPQERGLQRSTYLDVMEALLEAGADPDARLTMHPWYMVYSGCGNRNCGLVDTNGSTAFWRAAYATDVDAMRLLIEAGASADIPTKAPPGRNRRSPDEQLRDQAKTRLASDSAFASLSEEQRTEYMLSVRAGLPDSVQTLFSDQVLQDSPGSVRGELMKAVLVADSLKALEPDPSGLPPVPVGGPGVFPLHAATGVGYGEGFAGNAHRTAPGSWMPALRYLVEELHVDVNERDHNGYTALHHAAARGDNEMIIYLVEKGADVHAVSRRGQTTVDLANGPVQRVSPFPATIALLEGLGARNNHACMACE